MQRKVRAVVIDDHPLFREGVVSVLACCPDVEVVGQGASAHEAAEIAETHNPDVVLLDVGIPGGGLSAIKAIAAGCPETRVMMLTVSVDKTDVLEALRLGARAYVVKGTSGRELIQALYAVLNGERYLSPALGAMLLTDVDSGRVDASVNAVKNLSSREAAVLSLVTQGLSNKEVGARLRLSDKTIKHYLTSVFHKLDVRSRLEAALLMKKMSAPQPQAKDQRLRVEQRQPPELVARAADQGHKTLV